LNIENANKLKAGQAYEATLMPGNIEDDWEEVKQD
jgi:hypothetical protein